MSLIRETTPDAAAAQMSRRVYRSDAELKMRDAVERWGRTKWPDARVVHELVMDRGTVRADVAFVSTAHLVAIEIKSEYDDTSRLLHQAGMFRLAVPELWIACPNRHVDDAKLIRFLLPSIGVLLTDRDRRVGPLPDEFEIDEVEQAEPFQPWPASTLSLLWVTELLSEAMLARTWQGSGGTHAKLVNAMLKLTWPEQIAAVCRQLRRRKAFWRADDPITDA